MVKYIALNDEAEILLVDAVKANAITSVIFKGKTSYIIRKTDNVNDATVLFRDTQEEAPEDTTAEDSIILDEAEIITMTRDTETNTIPNGHEVDDVSVLIEKKFNDWSDKVGKWLHNIKDQIIGMQLSNLSRNNVSGKAVTSESSLYVDILKYRISELEKQLSEKNTIIDFLITQLVANSQDTSNSSCRNNITHRNSINKDETMTPYMKKKTL